MWGYTPKQINGYLELAAKRRKFESFETLSIHALASSGDGKAINKTLKDWEREL